MKKIGVLLAFISFSLSAQISDVQYLNRYKQAVDNYKVGNFTTAKNQLDFLLEQKAVNPVVPYALFYKALAAEKTNNTLEARENYRILFDQFPHWEDSNIARIRYAENNFKAGYFSEALKSLDYIDSKSLEPKVNGLMQHYLSGVSNLSELKTLYNEYPNFKVLAERIVEVVQNSKYSSKEDLELSDLLTNRFNLKVKPSEISKPNNFNRNFDDNTLDVAVMLPFALNSTTEREKNRYVYDMYSGMKMAETLLKQEGVPLNLLGFEVGKVASDFQALERDPNFKKIDLMFGPLYGKPNKLASQYAEDNNIIQVHPISNSSNLIKGFNNVFLVQPSYAQQAVAALNFAKKNFKSKTVSVYYGSSSRSKLMANSYAEAASKYGFTVNQVAQFSSPESIGANQTVGHVFFAGEPENSDIFIRALSQQNIASPVITTATTFNFEDTERGVLARDIYFIDPLYIDYSKPEVENFKRQYVSLYGALPSAYAYSAYDMLLFYGRMLKNGKSMFRLNLNSGSYKKDLTLNGFNYKSGRNENLEVPIVKFDQGKFILVNEE